MIKKLFLSASLGIFALISMSFTSLNQEAQNQSSASEATTLRVTTGANGEIINVSSPSATAMSNTWAWNISDMSGMTNIRNKPNGKVCMRLKAYTDYDIRTYGRTGSWLQISAIYNISEGYEVRLHSSSTGKYWIARSVLCPFQD